MYKPNCAELLANLAFKGKAFFARDTTQNIHTANFVTLTEHTNQKKYT